MPVARDATMCVACGVKEPWIPDEPTLSPRAIRLLVWGGGIALAGLLLLVSGVIMFGASEAEHDHRPPNVDSEAHEAR
jgi:hypothetical protein